MDSETPAKTLDVTGKSCPMPVVKTKQAVDDLDSGALLEVHATDAGSVSDIDGWAAETPGVLAGRVELATHALVLSRHAHVAASRHGNRYARFRL